MVIIIIIMIIIFNQFYCFICSNLVETVKDYYTREGKNAKQ